MIHCACCGAPLIDIEQACFNCLPGFYLRSTLSQRLPPKWIMESNMKEVMRFDHGSISTENPTLPVAPEFQRRGTHPVTTRKRVTLRRGVGDV